MPGRVQGQEGKADTILALAKLVVGSEEII